MLPRCAFVATSSHNPCRCAQCCAALTTARGSPLFSSISSSQTWTDRSPLAMLPWSTASSTVPPGTRTVRASRQMSVRNRSLGSVRSVGSERGQPFAGGRTEVQTRIWGRSPWALHRHVVLFSRQLVAVARGRLQGLHPAPTLTAQAPSHARRGQVEGLGVEVRRDEVGARGALSTSNRGDDRVDLARPGFEASVRSRGAWVRPGPGSWRQTPFIHNRDIVEQQ